jgi:hypothetical protein
MFRELTECVRLPCWHASQRAISSQFATQCRQILSLPKNTEGFLYRSTLFQYRVCPRTATLSLITCKAASLDATISWDKAGASGNSRRATGRISASLVVALSLQRVKSKRAPEMQLYYSLCEMWRVLGIWLVAIPHISATSDSRLRISLPQLPFLYVALSSSCCVFHLRQTFFLVARCVFRPHFLLHFALHASHCTMSWTLAGLDVDPEAQGFSNDFMNSSDFVFCGVGSENEIVMCQVQIHRTSRQCEWLATMWMVGDNMTWRVPRNSTWPLWRKRNRICSLSLLAPDQR